MRANGQHTRISAVVVLAVAFAAGPAAAQTTIIQADAAVNVGYQSQTVQREPPDPNDDIPDDLASPSNSFVFTDVRPGIAVQTQSARLTWRVSYLFAAILSLDEQTQTAYSNQASLSMAAELSRRSMVTLSASGTQGGTLFQLNRPPESPNPQNRAAADSELVTAAFQESYNYELGRQLNFGQGLLGQISAPQNDLGRLSSTVTLSLAIDRSWQADSFGAEVRGSVAHLEPLQLDDGGFFTTTNAVVGRWSHDFGYRWSGNLYAGAEQVYIDNGARPIAFLPNGGATVRMSAGKIISQLSYSHGASTNVQTGTVAEADAVLVQGFWNFDLVKPQILSFSAGFAHNEPIGESDVLIAAGSGNVVQGNVSFMTGLWKSILGTATYTASYQYGQAGGLEPSLAHVVLIGLTARYRNTTRYTPPLQKIGQRVDRSDATGFGDVEAGDRR